MKKREEKPHAFVMFRCLPASSVPRQCRSVPRGGSPGCRNGRWLQWRHKWDGADPACG